MTRNAHSLVHLLDASDATMQTVAYAETMAITDGRVSLLLVTRILVTR